MKNQSLHTGEMLTLYFNTKRIRRAALARKMNVLLQSLLGYQKKSSLQTAVLWQLSHALEHNFFLDIAAQLPATYTSDINWQAENQQRIANLEKEIEKLKIENEVLLRVVQAGLR